MPLIAAERAGVYAGKGLDKMRPAHLLILGAAVAGVITLGLLGARASTGGVKTPAKVTEDLLAFTPALEHPVIGPQQHVGGYVYAPHRYPKVCGGEITAFIRDGWPTLRMPRDREARWITEPPSEVAL